MASPAAAAVAVFNVLSELEVIFKSKEDQRTTLKAFLGEKYGFALLRTGCGVELVKHCGARWHTAGQ